MSSAAIPTRKRASAFELFFKMHNGGANGATATSTPASPAFSCYKVADNVEQSSRWMCTALDCSCKRILLPGTFSGWYCLYHKCMAEEDCMNRRGECSLHASGSITNKPSQPAKFQQYNLEDNDVRSSRWTCTVPSCSDRRVLSPGIPLGWYCYSHKCQEGDGCLNRKGQCPDHLITQVNNPRQTPALIDRSAECMEEGCSRPRMRLILGSSGAGIDGTLCREHSCDQAGCVLKKGTDHICGPKESNECKGFHRSVAYLKKMRAHLCVARECGNPKNRAGPQTWQAKSNLCDKHLVTDYGEASLNFYETYVVSTVIPKNTIQRGLVNRGKAAGSHDSDVPVDPVSELKENVLEMMHPQPCRFDGCTKYEIGGRIWMCTDHFKHWDSKNPIGHINKPGG
jgi:hypothetical protein